MPTNIDRPLMLTNANPIQDYVAAVRNRKAFRNSNKSFVGINKGSDTLTGMGLATHRGLSNMVRLALITDEPDYYIVSYDRVIAWHSTTRGAIVATSVPGVSRERYEWVLAPYEGNGYLRSHWRRAQLITTTINLATVWERHG